ncbi:hypothetical protein U9M48_025734 [Paspalum notatum var. saurae]|uniref:DUF569 domain-containing protein n=1 Tax=Paspalum notatum var. saurae TaxID=547442 RepID=A0AAQ3TTW0_PASNO
MDSFPDRAHVRLRSRVRGTFLCADEDGYGVSLTGSRESLNTAWQVHRAARGGAVCVLLLGAAYGRYLALLPSPAPAGHRGHRAVQAAYATLMQGDIAWDVYVAGGGDHVVLSHHGSTNRLRANGRYRRWLNRVSVQGGGNLSTMMHWVVEPIPLRSEPPDLPFPTPLPHVSFRMIVYVRADDLEHLNLDDRGMFMFGDRSVFQLRSALANQLQEEHYTDITLCVRAGTRGRFIPLVTDLPRNRSPLFIVVLTTGSPAALALRYPDVDVQ